MTDCPFQILGDPELPWQVREKHPPSQKLENLAEKPPFREGAVFGLSGSFRKNEQPGGRWKKRVVRMDATNRLLSIFCPGAVSASFPLLVSTLREPIPPQVPSSKRFSQEKFQKNRLFPGIRTIFPCIGRKSLDIIRKTVHAVSPVNTCSQNRLQRTPASPLGPGQLQSLKPIFYRISQADEPIKSIERSVSGIYPI